MDSLATQEVEAVSEHYACPRCGGRVFQKQIKKLLRGGVNTAVVNTVADVCEHCGESMYPIKQVLEFERIEAQLESGDTDEFRPLGRTFEVDLPETAWTDTHATANTGG